jgi:hypothetical protein
VFIENHDIQMTGSREFVTGHEVSERLTAWQGNNRIDISRGEQASSIRIDTESNRSVLLDISKAAMEKFRQSAPAAKGPVASPVPEEDETAVPSELLYMKMLLEKFFGIRIEIVKPTGGEGNENADAGSAQRSGSTPPQGPQMQGWGIHYSYHELTYEKESVRFSASGTVTTADGREINFDTRLEMSRETYEQLSIEFKAGDALIDPLVLNLDGRGVELTEEKYAFDLDADGEKENISFLKQGSGFLVLDKNGNGVVDDGSELFGPSTNDGFLELSAYDSDGNQWIDESDAIYYDLKLWTKDVEGTDQLSDLKANNIGAIYLAGTGTAFDLGQGQLKETGIYLNENGGTGFIQEVDLAA